MTAVVENKRDAIRVLNDNFRSTLIGGRVVMTQSVSELPIDVQADVLLSVKTFSAFSRESDPHGEHDFGSFEVDGDTYFWKIDYYDIDCHYGSENPANPEQTTRVLTIMRAEDY
jgi:hypothetical protein